MEDDFQSWEEVESATERNLERENLPATTEEPRNLPATTKEPRNLPATTKEPKKCHTNVSYIMSERKNGGSPENLKNSRGGKGRDQRNEAKTKHTLDSG